jgi:hypothetical protein
VLKHSCIIQPSPLTTCRSIRCMTRLNAHMFLFISSPTCLTSSPCANPAACQCTQPAGVSLNVQHHLARVCNPLHTQAALDLPFSSPLFPRNSRVIIDLRYRRNSLVAVLAKEHALADLYVTHRLDRLTSGVVIFAKNKSKADDIRRAIEQHSPLKIYLGDAARATVV